MAAKGEMSSVDTSILNCKLIECKYLSGPLKRYNYRTNRAESKSWGSTASYGKSSLHAGGKMLLQPCCCHDITWGGSDKLKGGLTCCKLLSSRHVSSPWLSAHSRSWISRCLLLVWSNHSRILLFFLYELTLDDRNKHQVQQIQSAVYFSLTMLMQAFQFQYSLICGYPSLIGVGAGFATCSSIVVIVCGATSPRIRISAPSSCIHCIFCMSQPSRKSDLDDGYNSSPIKLSHASLQCFTAGSERPISTYELPRHCGQNRL